MLFICPYSGTVVIVKELVEFRYHTGGVGFTIVGLWRYSFFKWWWIRLPIILLFTEQFSSSYVNYPVLLSTMRSSLAFHFFTFLALTFPFFISNMHFYSYASCLFSSHVLD